MSTSHTASLPRVSVTIIHAPPPLPATPSTFTRQSPQPRRPAGQTTPVNCETIERNMHTQVYPADGERHAWPVGNSLTCMYGAHLIRWGMADHCLPRTRPNQPQIASLSRLFHSCFFFFCSIADKSVGDIIASSSRSASHVLRGERIDNNNTHSCTTRSSAELSSSGADHARKSRRNVLSLRGISYAKGATNNRVHCSICMLPVHLLSYVRGEATDIVLL